MKTTALTQGTINARRYTEQTDVTRGTEMSAFLCTPKHIAVIASWAADRGMVADRAAAAHELASENLNSVRYRYEHREENLVEHFTGMDEEQFFATCTEHRPGYPPAQISVLADSLGYQSCEHPGWEGSEAQRIINLVLVDTAGYPPAPKAPWSI